MNGSDVKKEIELVESFFASKAKEITERDTKHFPSNEPTPEPVRTLDYSKMSKFNQGEPEHALDYSKMAGDFGKSKKRLSPSDEKKIRTFQSELLSAPFSRKKAIQDKINLVMSKYESSASAVGDLTEAATRRVPSEKVKGISYGWEKKGNVLQVYLEGQDLPLINLSPVIATRILGVMNVADKYLAKVDWSKPLDEIKDEAKDAVKSIKSKLELVTVAGHGATYEVKENKQPRLDADLTEGGPGSGGGETRPIKLPMSAYVSVGTRKGIISNMPFEEEEVALSAITHVGQKSYVPAKMKSLVKNPDVLSKKPVSLLYVPSEKAYHVMDGHHRYLAAVKLGIEKIPARVWIRHEPEPSAPVPAEVSSNEGASEEEILTNPPASDAPVEPATTGNLPADEPKKVLAELPAEPESLAEPTAPECSPEEPIQIVLTPAKDAPNKPDFLAELDAIEKDVTARIESLKRRYR